MRVFLLIVLIISLSFSEEYVHYRLGLNYMEKGEYELALDEYRKVISVYPDHYNSYYQIGLIRLAQDNIKLAEYNFKKALDFNPGWRKVNLQLAKIYEGKGEYNKSLEALQKAIVGANDNEKVSIKADIDRVIERKKVDSPKDVSLDSSSSKTTGKAKTSKSTTKPVKKERKIVITDDAKKNLDIAIRLYQDGVKNGDNSKLNEALEFIRKSLKQSPGYPAAYYYAGAIRRRFGQREMARVNFENAIEDPEMGYNSHFYLGKIYGEMKDYSKAIDNLNKYITKTEYDPGKREAEAMVERYNRQLSIKKESEKIDVNEIVRGDISDEISKLPNQLSLSEIEVRIAPLLTMVIVDTTTDEGAAMLSGVKLFGNKEYDKSIEAFQKVLENYPRGNVAANTIYNIGISFMVLHNWPRASNQFQQYTSRFPDGKQAANALFLSAVAQKEMKKNSGAERLFQDYIQKNRGGPWIGKSYEKLGDIYFESDEISRAVDAYDQADKNSSEPRDKVYANYKKAEMLKKLGNKVASEASYKKAIKIGEASDVFVRVPDSYYSLADTWYKDGKIAKALEYYKRATKLYTGYQDTPWGLYQIGNILKKQGKLDDAIIAYDKLINDYPDDYWSSKAAWKRKDAVWEHQYGATNGQ